MAHPGGKPRGPHYEDLYEKMRERRLLLAKLDYKKKGSGWYKSMDPALFQHRGKEKRIEEPVKLSHGQAIDTEWKDQTFIRMFTVLLVPPVKKHTKLDWSKEYPVTKIPFYLHDYTANIVIDHDTEKTY